MNRYECVNVWRHVSACALASMVAASGVAASGVQAQAPEAAAAVTSSKVSPRGPSPQGTSREYREVIDEAVREQKLSAFPEALALLLRAHALQPSARTLRGLGVVQFELKNYATCIARLRAALLSQERALTPEMRVEIEALLVRAQRFVGYFAVRTTPTVDGVQVAVDGAAVTLDDEKQVMLSIGLHGLSVQAQGYWEQTQRLNVQGGERLAVSFTLQPIQDAPVAALKVEKSKDSLLRNPWLWTGVGAVLVGGLITSIALSSGGDTAAPEPGDVGGVVVTLGGGP